MVSPDECVLACLLYTFDVILSQGLMIAWQLETLAARLRSSTRWRTQACPSVRSTACLFLSTSLHVIAGPGPLQTLFTAARPLPPAERSALLAADQNLASAHSSAASTDTQTAVPNLEEYVELHFVTFVEWEGQLVELDGRRKGPVSRGPIRKELLEVSPIRLNVEKCRYLADHGARSSYSVGTGY